MFRGFEKISFNQFNKDTGLNEDIYDSYLLPRRATKGSCGYDFYSLEDIVLKPYERKKIPTGYKAFMGDGEVLLVVIRSSLGFKYNVRMCNQVGVIDSDYYNNEDNEGHIFVALQNEGDENVLIKKGTAYCQGIFINYLTCGDDVSNMRISGIGSTNKKY